MTYDWNDIVIVGDSFCADRSLPYEWPQVLTSKITSTPYIKGKTPRGRGFPGASWWAARGQLLKELRIKVPKVVRVLHTEPFRIPHDTNWGLNSRSIMNDIIYVPKYSFSSPTEDFKKAAVGYYKHIFSKDYHLWTYNQWFK